MSDPHSTSSTTSSSPDDAAPSTTGVDDVSKMRGRIIVVDDNHDHKTEARIRAATARPITVVSNFYEAIGEIATTSLRAAPEAVIASIPAFGDRIQEYVEGLYNADPAIAVVALVTEETDDTAAEIARECVDAVLTHPVNQIEFERAIQEAGNASRGPRIQNAAALNEDDSVEEDLANQEEDERTSFDLDDEFIADDYNDDIDAITTSSPQVPSMEDGITDTDLICQVLQAPGSIVSLLELAIMSKTGQSDVVLQVGREMHILDIEHGESIVFNGATLGCLVAPHMSTSERTRWATWSAHYLALTDQLQSWKVLALTDDLTGARNRRFFDRTLGRLLNEASEKRQCVTLLLFDIDDFKQYNDRYGHTAGDEILIETVKLMESVIRPCDTLCRVGGDEFAVIFYDPEGERAPGSEHPRDIQHIIERFQARIVSHKFPKLGHAAPGRLTISGGLATYPWNGHDVESLYEYADQAALNAKQSGKNCIIVGPNR